MNRLLSIIIISLIIISCKEKTAEQPETAKVVFDQELANELEQMGELDQLAARHAYPPEGYKHLSLEQWKAVKDSIYKTNQKRLVEMIDAYGYLGFDRVEEAGESNFWVMVQHCDHDPEFQQAVLALMKVEVDKGNASPHNYGLLVDRVNLNTGKPQVYGTQVTYNHDIAQALPINLADSATVNERRSALGMEPLEVYLNDMTLMHFEMNKEFYAEKGITAPTLHKTQ
ncbi:DUF6624 domain-containing protein [Gilvibacter sediminis]|uniref:DUF6624 domain-containing protein n=1 Tax=Gilvibacter sediminis TaxID=379071 RepID=UPI002350491B|nr:DUF6624 domain-containing protein [Gilvibacter sediminis]MDC7998024.1 hypothetical protein [Gilvibacter sediminis]